MGLYEQHVVPRVINAVLRGEPIVEARRRAASGLSGDVLEVGFGSGLNVPYYPSGVRRVIAVDPSKVGRRLAATRIAASPIPVEFVGLDGQSLPLDRACVDHVLTTWTLCTIPDVDRALLEMRRVLRPGGQLHFAEHGRSTDPTVAKWQDRLTPVQRRLAGGCHLNRPIDRLISGAGFDIISIDTFSLPGPKPMGFMYLGLAAGS